MAALDKLTEQDILDMLEQYKSGISFNEIYDKYKVPHTTFERLRNKYGIKPNRSRQIHYNEDMQKRFDEVFRNSIECNYTTNKNNFEQKLKCQINQHYFDTIDTPNKAYILGLLYSDGNMSKKEHVCSLSLQERDKSILEKINKDMGNESKICCIPLKEKNVNFQNSYRVHMYGRQIYESLIMHGCHPAKSLDLEFPTNLPMNLYKHFLRGMIDGDGHIKNNKTDIRVRLTSTPMFCQVAMLLIETILKINCYIIKNNRSETNVDLCIAGRKQVSIFLNWIYDDDSAELYIKRKHDEYLSIINKSNKSLSD